MQICGSTRNRIARSSEEGRNDATYLRGTSDHVLDEVTVTGGIDDGEDALGGLELPESDIDGNTTLALSLQLVEHPGVLEGTLAELSGFLYELLAIYSGEGRWLPGRCHLA